MSIFNLFSSKNLTRPEFDILTDVHSHLLPGIDDGASDIDNSIAMIEQFIKLGYKKLITTPHILQDYYPNTPDIIHTKLQQVQREILNKKLDISLEAAAEYYLDEFLIDKVKNKENLLTFGDNYLLFEMSFMSESPFLKEFIFLMKSGGYIPILAHVERYSYYFNDYEAIEDLQERGCLMQVNINSLAGYYGKSSTQVANHLIDKGQVHLMGSDCHNLHHLEVLNKARQTKSYIKALNLPLINFTL